MQTTLTELTSTARKFVSINNIDSTWLNSLCYLIEQEDRHNNEKGMCLIFKEVINELNISEAIFLEKEILNNIEFKIIDGDFEERFHAIIKASRTSISEHYKNKNEPPILTELENTIMNEITGGIDIPKLVSQLNIPSSIIWRNIKNLERKYLVSKRDQLSNIAKSNIEN